MEKHTGFRCSAKFLSSNRDGKKNFLSLWKIYERGRNKHGKRRKRQKNDVFIYHRCQQIQKYIERFICSRSDHGTLCVRMGKTILANLFEILTKE